MKKSLATFASLLPQRSDYAGLKTSWRKDVLAGVTVGIVALPLALAFGVSSGVGAEAGLITAIVAGLIAAIFGGSNVQVSGPTGAMVVVLAPIVIEHGVGSVMLVSILSGVILVVAGALRLGRTVGFIPWPVIEGFTVGIGIIIFLQQFPNALAVSSEGHSTNALIAAGQTVAAASGSAVWYAIGTVIAVVLIMLAMARCAPHIPGSFVAIVVVSVIAAVAGLPLTTIGQLPHSLPAPQLPTFQLAALPALIGPAFAVAALAGIESLLSARVASTMADTGPYNADRELVGQGLASIGAGFFGGMPATGAIARTAVNVRSGARTRMAASIHALALLVVVYLAANVVSEIPLAALAGVLMVTAARMVSPQLIRLIISSTRADALVFIVTIIITVTFDLIYAVAIGVAVAAFLSLRALSRASGVHREELHGEPMLGDERIALFRVDGSLFFGAAERITQRVTDSTGIEVVILRLSQIQLVDATGAHTLSELVSDLERRGITVLVKGIQQRHMHLFEQLGVLSSLAHENHVFETLPPAIEHARSHVQRAAAKAKT